MRLATLPLFLALCALPLAARADDLAAGSTFTYTLAQYDTTTSSFTTLTSWASVPGGTVPFVLGAAVGTITEAHTSLPSGYDRFTFTFSANSDLFPQYTPGDDYQGLVGIENLQFDTPFQPTSAILTFSTPNGVVTFSDGSMANQDFAQFLSNPFDGNFIAGGALGGYDTIGGLNTTTITLQLSNAPVANTPPPPPPPLTTPTPEPSSLVLLATGLLGAAATIRRKALNI